MSHILEVVSVLCYVYVQTFVIFTIKIFQCSMCMSGMQIHQQTQFQHYIP